MKKIIVLFVGICLLQGNTVNGQFKAIDSIKQIKK